MNSNNTCNFIMKRGKNKGNPCGVNVKKNSNNNRCSKHLNKEDRLVFNDNEDKKTEDKKTKDKKTKDKTKDKVKNKISNLSDKFQSIPDIGNEKPILEITINEIKNI